MKKSKLFVARIPCVKSKEELLESIAKELSFPLWGENWDALDEMYSWMYWLKADIVEIYHEDLSCLPETDLKAYLSVMEYRKNTTQEHRLYFYINADDVMYIKSIQPDFFELEQVKTYHI